MHTDSLTGRLLHDDHHRVMDLLDRLDTLFGRHGGDSLPVLTAEERNIVVDLAAELDGPLESHFAAAEALFPVLASAGGHEWTADLLEDHEHMRPIARRLGRFCALALREGFDRDSWPVLRSFGEELVRVLVLHIQKEETTLVPATDALLSAEEDRAFSAAMNS
ncbi:hemerythrin domain-containing protein [Azospirillum sp. B506]|uniref:hemerythrin domain-containing protein n=1 Tax=Azospirillum sp. B506 TaxID=137721 RepID=UPI0003499F90|nr:hemerythrin domain-containing protein [Azospirillum sp. B506]